jgi:hypothetical protein
MKYLTGILIIISLAACSRQSANRDQLQAKTDSLQNQPDHTYKPGFGEFMSSIQVHHNKRWFAGTNDNWKLADFEAHEIRETLENIQNFNKERREAMSIGMITPALDSVMNAIKQQNRRLFKTKFVLLTSSCNNCHKATEHEFNVVIIPTNPPYSNQSFQPVR